MLNYRRHKKDIVQGPILRLDLKPDSKEDSKAALCSLNWQHNAAVRSMRRCHIIIWLRKQRENKIPIRYVFHKIITCVWHRLPCTATLCDTNARPKLQIVYLPFTLKYQRVLKPVHLRFTVYYQNHNSQFGKKNGGFTVINFRKG